MARFSLKAARLAVGACNALTWLSSAIVVGITGYFLKKYPHDLHLIFEIVIAAIVLGLWLPAFYVAFRKDYGYHYGPLNFIFSYLWLTSFIFAAQDYNQNSCALNAPVGGSCNLKFTSQAFIFVAFFFSFVAALIDMYVFRVAAVGAAEPVHPEKPVEAPTPTTAV